MDSNDARQSATKRSDRAVHAAARKQNALDQLAAVNAWLALPPKPKRHKHDYNLEPKALTETVEKRRRGQTPGRKVKAGSTSD